MEQIQKKPFKDIVYLSGLALVAISFFLYLMPEHIIHANRGDLFGYFWGHYAISIFYLVVLLINGIIKFKWISLKSEMHNTFIFLILCMIACFSLNKEINIFNDSASWLNFLLITMSITMIVSPFRESFPKGLQILFYFILGLGFTICLYFSIYLAPLYGIGILGVLFLGISLHVFIPLLFSISLLSFTLQNTKQKKYNLYSFISALVISVFLIIYFSVKWNSASNVIAYEYNRTIINSDNIYPAWFRVSQRLNTDWITERVLKSDLYYATPAKNSDFWGLPSRSSMNIVKVHDPLIMIASYFSSNPDITVDDRIKIIETTYGARHLTQERLWSGESLFTKNIISDVKLYPKLRIAYTEKILSIENKKVQNGWRSETQEAIYTFKIPEGAVVTSLSLWINGIEEKGYLTTKGKADSAYTSIVGVERRDPSVVHWQEGNTVSVRVFPCTPEENRRFKIGITSPLELSKEKLVYKNITFEGPFFDDATETINIRLTDNIDNLELPYNFNKTDDTNFIWEGNYSENWEITMPIQSIPDNKFNFAGNDYFITEQKNEYETFSADNIYMDINSAWTKKEFETIWDKLKNKNVYIYQDKIIKLDEGNKDEWFERLNSLNFSMFPFHTIKGESPLIISKSSDTDLFLKDVENSIFSSSLAEFINKKQQIRLFNLNENLSPYLKTLRDFRVFIFDAGDINKIGELVNSHKFIKPLENKNSIHIHDTGIIIHKEPSTDSSSKNAPDHLVRLYSYNNIVRQIGSNYFTQNYITDELISEAEKAYVVTPLSSLIVLETQKDYDRFGIKQNENESLKNASMSGAGSVPEPHEWALIIIGCLFILYLKFKSNLRSLYVR